MAYNGVTIRRKNWLFDTVIGGIVLVIMFILAMAAFWFWVEANHYKHDCEGPKTGRCGWAWCKYYDGSDYLHDFNF